MNYGMVINKFSELYQDKDFIFNDKELSHEKLFSLDSLIMEKLFRKSAITFKFLIGRPITLSKKRDKETNTELLSISAKVNDIFTLLLIVMDLVEEAIEKSEDDEVINLNHCVS
ncbi:hypothetical protein Psal006b_00520 [Piscirickettsia salmonis]|uniref:Type IV secretion system substrate protein SdhB n=1 Tax=Piscirickettsia salmonis TaxID=1238 RepID=A0A1L6TEK7_PISSA|nr:hypothetical protein [Piscirickettsia salmonis]AKP72670.1 hypothetical protein PSLF89_528 [Piscirickettsia salmonis LF-89 = ATCC VR-1361]ALB23838.1 type IV secretion system substrate protein SdhB [Piscirickettsia salmonis]ALY03678.1 hypothetical protein AWE47_13110 [Piscirickettsia salmonis]AMA43241.1 hypothetical protein AWJ11_13335 [Piscirickettsia salmonis]AOS35711.1 hypothetical protein AVM72_10455 [Piscirickettsia salmonis]